MSKILLTKIMEKQIDLNTPKSAMDYLKSLPVTTEIELAGHGEPNTTVGDAVKAITGEAENQWAIMQDRWEWTIGDLIEVLQKDMKMKITIHGTPDELDPSATSDSRKSLRAYFIEVEKALQSAFPDAEIDYQEQSGNFTLKYEGDDIDTVMFDIQRITEEVYEAGNFWCPLPDGPMFDTLTEALEALEAMSNKQAAIGVYLRHADGEHVHIWRGGSRSTICTSSHCWSRGTTAVQIWGHPDFNCEGVEL